MGTREKFASTVLSSFFAVTVSVAAGQSSLAVADETLDLRKAITAYNSSNFGDAIGYSQMYLRDHPRDAMAHYYLANSLRSLGHNPNALAEYNLALTCSKTPEITNFCKQAIKALSSSVTQASSSPSLSLSPSSSSALPSSSSALPSSSSALPSSSSAPVISTRLSPLTAGPQPTNDVVLDKVISRMQRQADSTSTSYARRADENAKIVQDGYLWRIREIKRKADEDVAAIEGSPTVTSTGKVVVRTTDIARVREKSDIAVTELASRAELAAKNMALDKESTLQNFQRQVEQWQQQVVFSRKNPGKGSVPSISLAGTDLYTRNYDVNLRPPAPEPEEMLATPERLVLDAHSHPGKTISRIVREPSLAHRVDPNTDLKVRAQLMHE